MMANTAQIEKSPNPGISGSQRNRRGSGTENEETIRSRDNTDLAMIDASYAYVPAEVLIKIFHYLDFYDIQAARLCCTHWFDVSNCPQFVSKRIFKITEGVLDSEHPAAKVISASKIENLYLKDIQFGDIDELFGQIGDKIKAITLDAVPFAHAFRLISTHFINLQSLKVCNIYVRLAKDIEYLPFGDLSRLKELELAENNQCVDKYLLDCSLCADALEKLTLESTKDLEVEVLKTLDKQAETLKILNLNFDKYSDRDLDVSQWRRIASKLSLKELSLAEDFSRDIVVEMIKNQKSLRSLHLELLSFLDDEYLTLIVQELPQLERLFLFNCLHVTDIGVGQLAKLSKLTVLRLQFGQISSVGVRNIIGQETSTRLQELYIMNFYTVNMDAVCYCAQNLQHLRVLGLSGCDIAVTDKSLNDIFKYQRNLRDLRLDRCEKVTDFGMLGRSSIRSLEKLERLTLRDCKKLSDATLCGISAPHLKFIDIRGCLRMTSRGISALVKNSPAIEEIVLTFSKQMNEEVIDVLTNGLSRLRTLKIGGCYKRLEHRTTDWKQIYFHKIRGVLILKRRTST